MLFGSVCSGIEAASVAFAPLGWQAAWLAEIEPFPAAVLAHHYPSIPNLGDMTKIAARVLAGDVHAPDVLCGGTPCQAFSVAGLRQSLDDERGNLTLKFVELANAIDHVRRASGNPETIVLWENVPGVLSTKDNAFGCFLAGLAGEDEPLQPPGGKWANAGAVYGPARSVAWRTLDAQYFGVAQRRRRVFVVASARNGFDPAQVLFEWDSMRRDTAPSRETRQVAPTIPARSSGGGGLGTDFDCDGGLIQAFGGNNQSGPIDVATARNACASASGRMDFESETFLVQPVAGTLQANGKAAGSATQQDAESGLLVAHTLRGEGFDASEDGTGRGTPLVPVAHTETMPTLRAGATYGGAGHGARSGDSKDEYIVPVAFDTTQITSAVNRSNPQPGDACHPLAAGAHAPAIAFDSRQDPVSSSAVFGALGSSSPQAQAVAVALRGREGGGTAELGDEIQNCLRASSGGGDKPHVLTAMQVRRLTPRECERLQGFPDGYTAIPWRGKPADQCPDGPRYKALGNSWAVPVPRWIAQRIQLQLART